MLDARTESGAPRALVREVDIESDESLLRAYLETIPVLVAGGRQLPLAVSPGAIRQFVAQALDGAVRG